MNAPAPAALDDAQVVLHLQVTAAPGRREEFLAFCRRAFPVYESIGGLRMALYEDAGDANRFDEAGYYRTMEDYRRSTAALESDPAQAALIKEWRSLLAGPPEVRVFIRR